MSTSVEKFIETMILNAHFKLDSDSLTLEVEVPEPLCEAIVQELKCNQKAYALIEN